MNKMIGYLFLFLLIVTSLFTNNAIAVKNNGELHLKGSLVDGVCTFIPTSENLFVDMGQYRTNQFHGIGSYTQNSIPFSIYLQNCNPKIWRYLNISFHGVVSPHDPQVFSAILKTLEGDQDSGIGIAIFDLNRNLIIPNNKSIRFSRFVTSDKSIKFIARYRQTSDHIVTGYITSEVWFTISYP